MNFSQLLAQIDSYPAVTDDTRDLVPGAVFVAGGGRERRAEFARQALAQGAAWIVCDEDFALATAAVIKVPCRRQAAAQLAQAYYGNPSQALLLLGVTGTCGKTTTSYALESLLQAADHQVGVIGTENIRFGEYCRPAQNTTPSVFILQRTLAEMRAAACTAVVMEVSSHAIEQQRIAGLAFDGVVFTNLSPEHLDFHGDMETYYACKKRLFTEYRQVAAAQGKTQKAVVNCTDAYGRRLYDELRQELGGDALAAGKLAGFNLDCRVASVLDASALCIDKQGIHGPLRWADGQRTELHSRLLGRFNAENLLGALCLARLVGLPDTALAQGIAALAPVPGRMEQVWAHCGRTVVVDFAHKPGALEVVMQALQNLQPRRLIVLFGCGGQRDRLKRPVMGKMAAAMAQRVILTADNSRGESTASITAEILAGVAPELRSNVSIIEERRGAIAQALAEAEEGDVVLLAGRGSEPGLNILRADGGTETIPLDDRQVARELAVQLWGEGAERYSRPT